MPLGVPCRRPPEAIHNSVTGTWRKPVEKLHPDGTPFTSIVTVCEDCWEAIPPYIVAPGGFVSPESDSKLHTIVEDGKSVIEALPKLVCHDCLLAAWARVYPSNVPLPVHNTELLY